MSSKDSIGSIKDYTPNFKLIIPKFDIATWHDYIEKNFRNIDALFFNLFGINNYSGPWEQITEYKTGQVLFIGEDLDSEGEETEYSGRLVKVLEDHTTDNSEYFNIYFKQHPTYYELFADASTAQLYAQQAQQSATNAKQSETNAKESETNSASSEQVCIQKANEAATSANNASISEQNAKSYETSALNSKNEAKISQDAAKISEINSKESEDNAKISETNASSSESNALSYKNSAQTSATTATSQANIATTKAQEALNSANNARASEINAKSSEISALNSKNAAKISQDAAKVSEDNAAQSVTTQTNNFNTYNNALIATKNQGLIELENKTDDGLSALSNASDALTKTAITNCITKIPQDIKVELNNGTPTLKAGSKVYDGAGNVINITSDISTIQNTSTSVQNCFLFIDTNKKMWLMTKNYCYSGATKPDTSTWLVWYDTTNKVINLYASDTDHDTVTATLSLPIAIGTTKGDGTYNFTSIDQVFNGFGYIGSTIFALSGVEGLIPNYRNTDGSLNNIKWKSDSVITFTNGNPFAGIFYFGVYDNKQMLAEYEYRVTYYDQAKNIVVDTYPDPDVDRYGWSLWGILTKDSTGRITSFSPKNTFQAVDRNDYHSLQGIDSNIDYVVESNYNSDGVSWYRKYKSGRVVQGGIITLKVNPEVLTLKIPLKNTKNTFTSLSIRGNYQRGSNAVLELTTTQIKVYSSDMGNISMYWLVDGQGA